MTDYIIIVSAIVVIALLKALRDVSTFRWQHSIFANVKWANKFRNNPGVLDWFHISDGAVLAVAFLTAAYLFTRQIWISVVAYIVFRLILYRVFNFLFHFVFTKKEFRDWGSVWSKI